MSDAKSLHLVANRDCGSCTSCCRDLAIDAPDLKKPPGILCVHCLAGKGCGIYQTRPLTCQYWFCGWRQMAQLDESWRPDRCEILITAADKNIPAGYPSDGLTFELIGSLERIAWPPLVQAICALIANSVPVFLSVRGTPGYASGNVFLNDELSGVVALGDPDKIAHMLRGALQACVNLPKTKVEFDAAP
jgi:hypothetical protein